MKPIVAIAAAAILSLALTPVRAWAAYCGPSADAMAVDSLAVSRGAGESHIMSIVVVQNYARVDVESKGRLTEYYVKDCGRWRFSGNALPPDAPASSATAKRFRDARRRRQAVPQPRLRQPVQRTVTRRGVLYCLMMVL